MPVLCYDSVTKDKKYDTGYTLLQLYKRRRDIQVQVETETYNFDYLDETSSIRNVGKMDMYKWGEIKETMDRC